MHQHHNNNTNVRFNHPCNNCGKCGHAMYQCKHPITSYGMIVFARCKDEWVYLMIRRQHSFGFMDFVRGNYCVHDTERLRLILSEMSQDEHDKIKRGSFETMRTGIHGDLASSQRKFEWLSKESVEPRNDDTESSRGGLLAHLLQSCPTTWNETEWEFPKGRKNAFEHDLECALREFEEETGIAREHIQLVQNMLPIEELFVGSNRKTYSHKYFLAYAPALVTGQIQVAEVNKMEWKSLSQCLSDIRSYSYSKKKVISAVEHLLQTYVLNTC